MGESPVLEMILAGASVLRLPDEHIHGHGYEGGEGYGDGEGYGSGRGSGSGDGEGYGYGRGSGSGYGYGRRGDLSRTGAGGAKTAPERSVLCWK